MEWMRESIRKIFIATVIGVLPFHAGAADLYEIEVTRVSQDIYEVLYHNNLYIKTRYCYEYVYFDEAILKIDSQYGYTIGEIIFEDGSKCDVAKILN